MKRESRARRQLSGRQQIKLSGNETAAGAGQSCRARRQLSGRQHTYRHMHWKIRRILHELSPKHSVSKPLVHLILVWVEASTIAFHILESEKDFCQALSNLFLWTHSLGDVVLEGLHELGSWNHPRNGSPSSQWVFLARKDVKLPRLPFWQRTNKSGKVIEGTWHAGPCPLAWRSTKVAKNLRVSQFFKLCFVAIIARKHQIGLKLTVPDFFHDCYYLVHVVFEKGVGNCCNMALVMTFTHPAHNRCAQSVSILWMGTCKQHTYAYLLLQAEFRRLQICQMSCKTYLTEGTARMTRLTTSWVTCNRNLQ